MKAEFRVRSPDILVLHSFCTRASATRSSDTRDSTAAMALHTLDRSTCAGSGPNKFFAAPTTTLDGSIADGALPRVECVVEARLPLAMAA